jgi:hypothetical protein
MRRFFFALALSVTGISNLLKVLLGLALHGFTTYLAFKVSGFFWAAVTFFTPPFAELYWIFRIWSETGIFWSYVAIGSALYIVLWVVLIIFASIATAAEPSR